MGTEGRTRWGRGFRPNRGGCGCGSGGFLVVVTVGILMSLFNADLGVGASVRIPVIESNVTLAGSIGAKEKALDVLPGYTQGRLGGNQNFINNSTTLTIGPAEGTALLVVGRQEGAPAIDLHLVLR